LRESGPSHPENPLGCVTPGHRVGGTERGKPVLYNAKSHGVSIRLQPIGKKLVYNAGSQRDPLYIIAKERVPGKKVQHHGLSAG